MAVKHIAVTDKRFDDTFNDWVFRVFEEMMICGPTDTYIEKISFVMPNTERALNIQSDVNEAQKTIRNDAINTVYIGYDPTIINGAALMGQMGLISTKKASLDFTFNVISAHQLSWNLNPEILDNGIPFLVFLVVDYVGPHKKFELL